MVDFPITSYSPRFTGLLHNLRHLTRTVLPYMLVRSVAFADNSRCISANSGLAGQTDVSRGYCLYPFPHLLVRLCGCCCCCSSHQATIQNLQYGILVVDIVLSRCEETTHNEQAENQRRPIRNAPPSVCVLCNINTESAGHRKTVDFCSVVIVHKTLSLASDRCCMVQAVLRLVDCRGF